MQNLLHEWLLQDLNYTAVTTKYKIYLGKWKQLLISLRTCREMLSVEFVSREGIGSLKELDGISPKEHLGTLGLSSLERRMLRGDLSAL